MTNQTQAQRLFGANSIFVIDKNVIPLEVAESLTSPQAVQFARGQSNDKNRIVNGYGIGDYTMWYLTERGFFTAIAYMNISEYRDKLQA